jgi:hypothetical protein
MTSGHAGEVPYPDSDGPGEREGWIPDEAPSGDTVEGCSLGHTRKAMECPSCSGSTDPAWWRWYRGRTQSAKVKAAINEWLTRG